MNVMMSFFTDEKANTCVSVKGEDGKSKLVIKAENAEQLAETLMPFIVDMSNGKLNVRPKQTAMKSHIPQKTFTFSKTAPTDLSNDEEAGATIIKCGMSGSKFTMTNYMQVNGHDDSLSYQAVLCMDGEPVCSCFNDGWGGETLLTPTDSKKFELAKSKINGFKWMLRYGGCSKSKFDVTLEFIADILANTCEMYYQKAK